MQAPGSVMRRRCLIDDSTGKTISYASCCAVVTPGTFNGLRLDKGLRVTEPGTLLRL